MSATGGLTIPSDGITRTTNAKTRALTKEEIETERNAQVNVQKYLESQKAKGLSVVDTTSNESARPPPVVVNMDPGTVSLIDKLLSRSGMPGTGTATALPKSGASSAPQQSPQQRAPAPATPASTQARVQTNQQQQQQQQKQKQPVRPATPTQTVKSVPAVPKAVSPPTVTAKLSPPPQRLTASTPNVQTAANTGKPLSEEENQAIKDSTEWLIKHRWVMTIKLIIYDIIISCLSFI